MSAPPGPATTVPEVAARRWSPTGRDNAPARRLYERLGFRRAGDDEVLPGLVVTRYVHSAVP